MNILFFSKKNLLLLIFFSFLNLHGSTVVDTARFEVIYMHVAYDNILDRKEVTDEMLSVGDRFNLFSGYGDYQRDSIYQKDPEYRKLSIEKKQLINRDFDATYKRLLTDKENNTMEYYQVLFGEGVAYQEPCAEFEWEIYDDTEDILGYECRKASTYWRGRKWFAWFSDIPVDGGPWKFKDLPGLILKLESEDGAHSFVAEEIRNDIHPLKRFRGRKVSREKFNQEEKYICENFGKILSNSGMVSMSEEEKKKAENRKKFYVPMELE